MTWTAPSGTGGSAILGYRIYRGNAMDAETWLVDVGPVLSYNDTGLLNNSTCYYKVQARNANGYGPNSTDISAMTANVPSAPLNLIATAGNGVATLDWNAPASNGRAPITGYVIFMGTAPGGETIRINATNVTQYTIASLVNGQAYYFKIAAVNGTGTGANSTETSAIPRTVPAAPITVSATPGSGKIVLSWSAPANNGGSAISNYKIYRGTAPSGETLYDTVASGTIYTDTSVVNGTHHRAGGIFP